MKYKMRVTYECTLVKTTYVEVEAESDEDAVQVAVSKVADPQDDTAWDWEEDIVNGDYYAELADESQEIKLEPIETLLRLNSSSDEQITTKIWGPRCEEYEPGCICCEAWRWLDEKGRPPRVNDPAFKEWLDDAMQVQQLLED